MGTEDNKSNNDEDTTFLKLMEKSGVARLNPDPAKRQIDQPLIMGDESLNFDDSFDWRRELERRALSDKFSGLQKTTPRKTPKKLKITREFTPDDILDLHGEITDSALLKVQNRIQTSKKGNYQALLIITGKGINSEEKGGVLGKAVWSWLKHHQVDHPIQFQWAPPFLGGKGAILVFF